MKTVFCGILLLIFIGTLSSISYAEDPVDLTIRDAVEISLSNNLGLKIQRITPDVDREDIAVAESEFDSIAYATGTVSRSETVEDPDIESQENELQAGVGKKFVYGTEVSAYTTMSNDSYTDSTSGDVDGTSVYTNLSVTQPLLKNRGTAVNRRNIVIAENSHKKSELAFKQAAIDTVAETKTLYWQLYSAVENLTVREKSLDLAKQFLSEVEEKVRVGSAARLDTLQAKAEVASREGDVIAANNDVMNNQDTLANYIYGGLKDTRNIRCLQEPLFEAFKVDEQESVQTAMGNRTEYLQAKYDIASAETEVVYTRNQTKPQLDLIGSAGYNEGDSDNDTYSSHQDFWNGSLSLSLEFPWGFRQEAANYRSAKLSLNQSRILLKQTESQILLEVRTAARNVASTHKQYQAASLAAKLAEEKLAAEQEKYHRGLSTSYNVLLYQRDLTDASVNLVDAAIAYQLAIVSLNQAMGVTLDKNDIRISDLERD